MKKFLVLSLGILLCASVVFGQAGRIGLFEDTYYVDSEFSDTAPGVKHVYVVHKLTWGATASQWMLVNNGMLCAYLAESSLFLTIGSAFSGIAVGYGACRASDILLLDIVYFCQGLTPVNACVTMEVVPDPRAPTGTIEVVDCSANKLQGFGGTLFVNDEYWDCFVPTQETTWGQLKALYR